MNSSGNSTSYPTDPGEAPPGHSSRFINSGGAASGGPSSSSVAIPSVAEVRENAAALLWDDDNDEETGGRASSGSFRYNKEDEENSNGIEGTHDQLPSAEELRLIAGRILRAKTTRDLSPEKSYEQQYLTDTIKQGIPIRIPRGSGGRYGRLMMCIMTTIIVALVVAVSILAVQHQRAQANAANDPAGDGNTEDLLPPLPSDPHPIDPTIPDDRPSPRFLSTVSFLSINGISESETLQTNHSPQYRAAFWMANTDPEMRDIPLETGAAAESFIQRYALAVFYYSTGGPDWTKRHKFLSEDHECSWYKRQKFDDDEVFAIGVTCNAQLEVESILIREYLLRRCFLVCMCVCVCVRHACRRFCSVSCVPSHSVVRSQQVLTVFLSSFGYCDLSFFLYLYLFLYTARNELRGVLPSELSHLKSLKFMDLNRNQLVGRIPERYETLELLEFLDLRFNLMSGTIPIWIGTALSELEVLALSHNLMNGPLPESLTNARKLLTLGLDNNDFSGPLTSINGLTNLEFLYLDKNGFQDTIDDSFLRNLEQLIHLDLSQNKLSASSLPVHMLRHPRMTVLDLHDNAIGGLPDDIPQNTVLQFLALHDNAVSGPLPGNLWNLSALTHLDVTDNDLTGTIPAYLGSMTNLSFLFIGENNFTPGGIEESLAGLPNLRELSLAETGRTGTIPQWVGTFNELVLLDLSRNSLTGTIPAELWQTTTLAYALLNRNKLTGSVTGGFDSVSSLRMLLLDKNDIRDDLTNQCNGLALETFATDCAGPNQDVTCPCCTVCCNDADGECNDDLLYTNIDPQWQYNYTRSSYSFSPVILANNR